MIPSELKRRNRWLIWRYEERFGKRTKVPFNSNLPYRFASVTDPRTWSGYRVAEFTQQTGKADGIGYVLGDGHTVVDLDNCLIDGQPTTDAERIVDWLNSYTEVSPSGKGLHIFLRGLLPLGRNRSRSIEAYDRQRFIAVTGHIWNGLDTIQDRQQELNAFCAEYLPAPELVTYATELGTVDDAQADEEVLDQARNALNGDKFERLWEGNWEGEYPSQSEADLALATLLAFWTKGNVEQIDRLFRQSALFRDKWNRVGERTIARALSVLDNSSQCRYI